MKKIEQEILLAAYENHTHERRVPAHWRICIKSYISQGPIERSMEPPKMINGIHVANWLQLSDLNPLKNLISNSKNRLEQFLKSHHIEGLEPGRTRHIQPEIFLKLGFVFVLSSRLYEKSKAESLMREWDKLGLDTFILAELPPGADFYASEALGLTKYTDMVKTVHLVHKGFSGRIPGSVEGVLVGEKKAVIEEAVKVVDTAFQSLEKSGYAIQVKGFNLSFEWNGLSLTKLGVVAAEALEENIYLENLAEQAAKAPKSCKIKCLSCGEVILRTNNLFRSDRAVTGDMIEFISNLSEAGWSVKFGPNDVGDSIMCPNCGAGLIDPGSFRFLENALVDAEESEDAGVDFLLNFISERCVTDPEKESTAGDLYSIYESWVQDINEEPISKKAFGLLLAEKGFISSRASGGVRMWTGIGLK